MTQLGVMGLATQYQRASVTRLLCTLVLSSILMACSGGLQQQPGVVSEPAPDMFSPLDRPAEQYRAQAALAEGDDALRWQVLAIRALLQQGDTATAAPLLDTLRGAAPLAQQPVVTLLDAAAALAGRQPDQALQRLSGLDPNSLPANGRGYYLLLRANAHEQQQQPIEAARALIERHDLLAQREQGNNRERIHQLLNTQSPRTLQQAQGAQYSEQANGWFRLMAILGNPDLQPAQRQWQLQSWNARFPEHPARAYLPDSLSGVSMQDFRPSHIAVLLPLSGRLAEQGNALRSGILSAHQGQSSRLSFFDTQGRDMASLYQQVEQAGADFILGPLLKEEIDALTGQNLSMPVLALNRPSYLPGLANIYYFSLSPEAEAAEAARQMWDNGHQQPLVFAPANDLGRRMATEFNRQWQQQSGHPAIVAYFNNQAGIEADVRRALNSRPSMPAGQVQPVGEPAGAMLPPREIDSVFMASNATETRFILPYFDFVRDSRAARLPTYVTSRSHVPAGEAPMSELNGLWLADMPWLFDGAPQLKDEVLSLWPAAGASWLRLFAMGYDALTLIPQLNPLRQGAHPVPALTGELSVTPDGVLQRRLQWMEYSNGDWIPAGQR